MASHEVKAPKGPLDSFQGALSELASILTESALEGVWQNTCIHTRRVPSIRLRRLRLGGRLRRGARSRDGP